MPRSVVLSLVLAVLFAPGATHAQPAGKVHRIGVLLARPVPAEDSPLQAFRQRLRELGYVEGQNVAIDWRRADGRLDRLPDLAAELVRLKADVIVADVTPAINAAMQATSTVPIVMGMAADPVGSGLVSNLPRPGGNVTRVSVMLADVSGKRLQLLKDALPRISRVAVPWNPSISWHKAMLAELEPAARSLGLHLLPVAVEGPGELEGAFSAMARGKVDAAFLGDSPIFSAQRTRLLDLTAKHRLPMIFGNREWVAAGGLMSYGPSFSDMFGRAAFHVDKILKGARPGDLPVEQPTRVELVINLKTAKALGLTIQPSVLARADQVIQ
jgi:putative tryptophan/tyrosine transport system substrate-binding protein